MHGVRVVGWMNRKVLASLCKCCTDSHAQGTYTALPLAQGCPGSCMTPFLVLL